MPRCRPPLQLRCYRLSWFFQFITYSLGTSLLLVTLLRNVLVGDACAFVCVYSCVGSMALPG